MQAYLLLIFFGFCSPLLLKAQQVIHKGNTELHKLSKDSRVKWLKNNAVKFRSINPADEDFSDLMPLKKVIGNAEVVLLGEQTHYDGNTFLGKIRLIKFLHQEMGFDLLAFESSMYSVAKAWEDIRAGKDAREAFKKAVYFGNLEEYVPLTEYLSKKSITQIPLELAGFDLQLNGAYTRDSLRDELKRYFGRYGYSSNAFLDSSTFAKDLIKIRSYQAPEKSTIDTLEKFIKLADSINKMINSFESAYFLQFLQSTKRAAQMEFLNAGAAVIEDFDLWRFGSIIGTMRDEQMAENLLWYKKQYPNRKIIGWGAAKHFLMDWESISTKQDTAYPRGHVLLDRTRDTRATWDHAFMGITLKDSLKDKLYNIAFISYEGEYGTIFISDSAKTNRNKLIENQRTKVELEEMLAATGFDYAFVDLKKPVKGGEWLHGRIIARPTGHGAMEGRWFKAVDGFFFTRKNFPRTVK